MYHHLSKTPRHGQLHVRRERRRSAGKVTPLRSTTRRAQHYFDHLKLIRDREFGAVESLGSFRISVDLVGTTLDSWAQQPLRGRQYTWEGLTTRHLVPRKQVNYD